MTTALMDTKAFLSTYGQWGSSPSATASSTVDVVVVFIEPLDVFAAALRQLDNLPHWASR